MSTIEHRYVTLGNFNLQNHNIWKKSLSMYVGKRFRILNGTPNPTAHQCTQMDHKKNRRGYPNSFLRTWICGLILHKSHSIWYGRKIVTLSKFWEKKTPAKLKDYLEVINNCIFLIDHLMELSLIIPAFKLSLIFI